MADIKLNFINASNDANNSKVVIFQKNEAASFDELAVAWKVIENCGKDWCHPFTYPMEMFVAARDSFGNLSTQIPATNGQLFSVLEDQSGDTLQLTGQCNAREVDVENARVTGSIDAQIYKDGRLLATKTGIAPKQMAAFQFKPIIYIGVASQIEEGEVMNSAILSKINDAIPLLGIKSADLVMKGGGSGPGATAFTFQLENIVNA